MLVPRHSNNNSAINKDFEFFQKITYVYKYIIHLAQINNRSPSKPLRQCQVQHTFIHLYIHGNTDKQISYNRESSSNENILQNQVET